MNRNLIMPLAAAVLATGCGSITGLANSSSKYACQAPEGVSCTSVSGVYANSQNKNVPSLRSRSPTPADIKPFGGSTLPVIAPGMPIRSQPRTLRIWAAPWVDDDGTLHDQSYMYVMVESGKWLVERSREATVKKTMTRLRPLGKARPQTAQQGQRSGQLADVRNDRNAQVAAREAAIVPAEREEAK